MNWDFPEKQGGREYLAETIYSMRMAFEEEGIIDDRSKLIDRAYWVYFKNNQEAPYQSHCNVTFYCDSIANESETYASGIYPVPEAVTGVVEKGSEPIDTGLQNMCYFPFENPDCVKSDFPPYTSPSECLALNMQDSDGFGQRCRTAFNLLSDANKADKVTEICERYPSLGACSCLERSNPLNPIYSQVM